MQRLSRRAGTSMLALSLSLVLLAGCETESKVTDGPEQPVVSVGGATNAQPVAPIVDTPTAASPVQIGDVRYEPGAATILLQNVGFETVDLTGWRLQVGNSVVVLPEDLEIEPREMLRIHTGVGTSTEDTLYLGQQGQPIAVLLQPGTELQLVNNRDIIVSAFKVQAEG